MLNLIRGEFRKIFTSKSLIVFLAIPVGLSLLSMASERILFEVLNSISDGEKAVYTTDLGYVLLSSVAQDAFFIVMSVFLAIWNVKDYSTGSIRNMLSRGCTRTNIYFAKYLVSMVTVVMYTVVNTLFSVLFSFMFSKVVGTVTINIFGLYLLDIFMVLAIATTYFSVIMMFQKLAPAIIVNLVSGGVFGVILTIVQEVFIKNDKINLNTLALETIIQRLPVKVLTEQTSSQGGSLTQLIAQLSDQLMRPFEVNSTFILHMNIVCVMYIAIFLTIGFLVIRKKEY